MNLLPAIDILGGKAVRLAQGDYQRVTVYNDDPVAQARIFADEGATWLHVVDLDGARDGVPGNAEVITRIIAETGLKVEVGGGVRTLDTLGRYVEAGATRVVMGTALIKSSQTVEQAVARYGSVVTAGIDARDGYVAVEGWVDSSRIAATELVARLGEMGIAYLVYTDISRDGMQTGIDAAAYARIAQASGVGVIASGGISTLDDLRALSAAAADVQGPGYLEGAITGRAIYEGSFSVAQGLDAVASR
ncbi:MAG: 1-(5-phosphoribosyl)-5-[(5-phosphoribosylamino)methylideneamino]imidazole-4-carboxamide isomerase [Coriobacteriales bacterium]|nr:1-(5-phosphoribosyl)-5-[(5-phosphoribosylamino)methylideneamino]imidazole-4-carboxamide isomerase [Coriobacteriales bacterium]